MKYFSENEKYIEVICESCKKTINIDKNKISNRVPSGYNLKSKIKCPCGQEKTFIKHRTEEIFCPKCESTQLTANKKGFGLGKAAVGGALLGGVGLLGGFVGSNKIQITCLKCGHKWKP